MKYLLSLALACFVAVGMAQQNTNEKINQDLEVAAEVLTTLLEREHENPPLGLWRRDVEARYVPDVGAVFTLASSPFRVFASMAPKVHADIEVDEGNSEVIVEGNRYLFSGKGRGLPEIDEDRNAQIESAARNFFADYGSLLRRLDRDDQVVVKTSTHRGRRDFVLAWNDHREGNVEQRKGIEIKVKVSDLLDHDEGKINQETLNDRITADEVSITNPKDEPELAVFGSILHRVFKPDFSKTYYMESAPYFDRTGSMGVTYHVKVFSSSSEDGLHFIPTLEKGGLSQEERDEIIDGLYDDFVHDFKVNVLEYGHTLKSVAAGEAVLFNINLTECKGCDMPKEIELSVKKSILDGYRKGSFDLDGAMKAFNLRVMKE